MAFPQFVDSTKQTISNLLPSISRSFCEEIGTAAESEEYARYLSLHIIMNGKVEI